MSIKEHEQAKITHDNVEDSKVELIESYVKFVEEQAKNRTNVIFNNSSIDHSVVIAKYMFASAENSIRLLSGTLTEVYYEKIKKFLIDAAKRIKTNGAIKILTIEECDNEKIEELQECFNETNKEIGVNVIEYISAVNSGKPNDFSHFYVIDKDAWRVEEPHDHIKGIDCKVNAKVCFNDRKIGRDLCKSFDDLWSYLVKKI